MDLLTKTLPPSAPLSDYLVIGVALTLGTITLILLYLFIKRDNQTGREEAERAQIYQKIIQEAYTKAQQLLNNTVTTSGTLLESTKTTNEKISEDLDRTLQLVAQHHIQALNGAGEEFQKEYLAYLGKLKDQLHQQVDHATQTAEEKINETIESFSKSLLGKTLGAQEIVDVKVQTMVAQAENQIGMYKQSQMAKIDTEIKQLLQATYEKILKENLPDEINQKFILAALERAKKEGVFTL